MIRNEKMYNKLNSMTVKELIEYARRYLIAQPDTETPKAQLVEEIMNSVHFEFYYKCKKNGYINVEDGNQLNGIIKIAKDFDLQYEDIKTVFHNSEDYYNTQYAKNRPGNMALSLVIGGIILIVLFVIVMFTTCVWGAGGRSKWSQLTPEEQDNARFAYEAQQAADDYRSTHP